MRAVILGIALFICAWAGSAVVAYSVVELTGGGEQGPQGPQGEAGARGPQGFDGSQGATGLRGLEGPEGATGRAGISGYDTGLDFDIGYDWEAEQQTRETEDCLQALANAADPYSVWYQNDSHVRIWCP